MSEKSDANVSDRIAVAYRLNVPVTLHWAGDAPFTFLSYLRVAPFESEERAHAWERDLILHAIIDWMPLDPARSQGRKARGRAVSMLTGRPQVEVSAIGKRASILETQPDVLLELGEGLLTLDSDEDSPIASTTSPGEIAANLFREIRAQLLNAEEYIRLARVS